ncbi:MAG TPA: hypothetical protein VHE34_16870 [Puia sp.]|uniref:hypothetical protein n=1 Tax=Puia sp. TaxID=2045100 RepID=UPI002B972C8D|nr:hypothetical protein [Puia sp.]HVU96906.1 hypothetical protein [Puia sp.]
MKRQCNIVATSNDGRRHICIDKINKKEILAYLTSSERHLKKWRHIVELLLGGHVNHKLYDKEEINDKSKGVTAMKFFKGQENDRIYCKEQRTKEGVFIIVAAHLYEKKKSQKVTKKEIPLIEKIGQYEYEIEKL